jgi:hypothetical protein
MSTVVLYCKTIRATYGLPEAGVLAKILLKERHENHDYIEVKHTPSLSKHPTPPRWSALTIGDF